jgi:hydroxypyruvate reductase
VIGNNRTASLASLNYLKSKGLNTLLRSASLDREAKCAGFILVSVAREIAVYDNPVRKPSGIVAGGEITVAVKGEGVGGRNQELALFAATKISGIKGCVVASLSTDGVEGSTDAAGPSLIAILYSRRKNWSLLLRSF